jgi:integrase
VLEPEQLRTLLDGFRGKALYPIVATAIFTGARRNEILALMWRDLDLKTRTLRIERSVELTRKYGLNLKEPKRAKHKRTIQIDDMLIEILLGEKKKHLQIAAGVPDGTTVDLSLVKLPDDALVFPGPPAPGPDESFSFTRLRDPDCMTKMFTRWATTLGFPGCAFMISVARTRPCCSTTERRYMSSPQGAVTTRRCCCGSTPNGRRRPTRRQRRSSPRSLRRSSAAEDANSTFFT